MFLTKYTPKSALWETWKSASRWKNKFIHTFCSSSSWHLWDEVPPRVWSLHKLWQWLKYENWKGLLISPDSPDASKSFFTSFLIKIGRRIFAFIRSYLEFGDRKERDRRELRVSNVVFTANARYLLDSRHCVVEILENFELLSKEFEENLGVDAFCHRLLSTIRTLDFQPVHYGSDCDSLNPFYSFRRGSAQGILDPDCLHLGSFERFKGKTCKRTVK